MAPQPFKGSWGFGLGAVPPPRLAALAMRVISIWSEIDYRINGMLAVFLTTDIDKATLMLQSINQTTQRTVIKELAATYLSKQDLRLFNAILKTIKSSEKRRHAFAHHIWAVSHERPDSILLIDPDDLNTEQARTDGSKFEVPIQEFTEQDLRDDIKRAERAYDLITGFFNVLMTERDPSRRTRDGALAAAIRARLLAEPLIQQELQKPDQTEQSSPSPQQQPPPEGGQK